MWHGFAASYAPRLTETLGDTRAWTGICAVSQQEDTSMMSRMKSFSINAALIVAAWSIIGVCAVSADTWPDFSRSDYGWFHWWAADPPSTQDCDAACPYGIDPLYYEAPWCQCANLEVAIKAHDGQYLVPDTVDYPYDGQVRATGTSPTYFQVGNADNHVLHDGDVITINTFYPYDNDCDCTFTATSNGPLTASFSEANVGSTEKFIINDLDCSNCDISSGDAVVFRNYAGTKYWSAVDAGGDVVNMDADDWGAWEEFQILW